ncbi:hypothetical protein [Paenibacillus sp. UNC499MF]|uniref:hypothetical protein n=1 Tax=Paenibacillus sp. UNC499MF TaxID=1502751 RepID=UPI0008A03010|nr:hypothetical protein [Paenibacillus sp. UNC499MF]SEG57717.1 hypothetical protein SAMN02799616_03624 [Paenibacillus sp. UNC499MF]
MSKKVVISGLILLIAALTTWWFGWGKANSYHRPLHAEELSTIKVYRNADVYQLDPSQFQHVVDLFNKAHFEKDNDEGLSTTLDAGMIFKYKNGKYGGAREYGKTLSIIRDDHVNWLNRDHYEGNKTRYFATSPELLDFIYKEVEKRKQTNDQPD